MNYFCTETPAVKNYYLLAYPHALYMDSGTTIMNYQQLFDITKTTPVTNFNYYEWNQLIIHVDSTPGADSKKTIGIYSNFNFINPVMIYKIDKSIELKLKAMAFCNGTCIMDGVTYTGIEWGSAFYKKLRIWNSNTNLNIIRDYETNL